MTKARLTKAPKPTYHEPKGGKGGGWSREPAKAGSNAKFAAWSLMAGILALAGLGAVWLR